MIEVFNFTSNIANKICPWQVDELYSAEGGLYSHEALDKVIVAEIVVRLWQPVHVFCASTRKSVFTQE